MNKKILLFSRDPGGCNVVAPLFTILNNKYEVKLYGKDIALSKYKEYNLVGVDILDVINSITIEEIEKFLLVEKPDFIITGTSADDFTEKYIWKVSEKLKIPSFAILDQWTNYGVRFSEFGVSELEEYDKSKEHIYLPYRILVMDEYAKDKLLDLGIDNDKVLVSGHPYFDYLNSMKNQINNNYINELRKNILECREEDLLITFVSEPITKTYKEKHKSEYYLGYTEKTIFKSFIQVLNNFSKKFDKSIKLIIRPHPKEDIDSYDEMIDLVDKSNISVLVNKSIYGLDLIHVSDLICGMSSMFLIESSILLKPIISIQIGLLSSRENPFILHNKGIIDSVFSIEDLEERLENILIQNNFNTDRFEKIEDAIKNVIVFMEEILCQN